MEWAAVEDLIMSIILARHGQTEHNRDNKILGSIDSPLTAQGRESAQMLSRVLTGLKPVRAFCSPLGRARDTAGILCQGLGLEPEPRAEMAELSAGEWEGLHREAAIGKERPYPQGLDLPASPGGELPGRRGPAGPLYPRASGSSPGPSWWWATSP